VILNFDKEIAELQALGVTIPDGKELEVAFVLVKVLSRGYDDAIKRAVGIVQRKAINPMPIVEEIRRPIR
jgi:hypothetical protein